MAISKRDNQELRDIFYQYKEKYEGCKEDYFALLYLTKKFKSEVEEIAHQVAFGGFDYGLDAYYMDRAGRNLYLYQFKWSEDYNLFKDSLERLANEGLARIFGRTLPDGDANPFLHCLRGDLYEHKELIDRIYIRFIFKGDAAKAEKSEGLQFLREALEDKKFLIDQYFENRRIDLRVEFLSTSTLPPPPPPPLDTHTVSFTGGTSIKMPDDGKTLYVGFMCLNDLSRIHEGLGQRFFSRNIRAGLSPDRPPNKKIRAALEDIVIKGQMSPEAFAFHHNGVALAAEQVEFKDGEAVLFVPRLLNGAQTVTTFAQFLKDRQEHPALKSNQDALRSIRVLAKIVVDNPASDFVTNVTISNNQQNPVDPWNLRANDRIQCELQEKLRTEVRIGYARQEGTFTNLSEDELEELGIEETKAIEIKPLAQTFLAAQGEIDRMAHLPKVFEEQTVYDQTFKRAYLNTDARKIVLGYKIHLMIGSIMRRLAEVSPNYLTYGIRSARNLVWALLIQALLNDPKLPEILDDFGTNLARQVDFNERLKTIATNRILQIVKDVVNGNEDYRRKLDEEKYTFLRQKEFFRRCMNVAEDKYGWHKKYF